MAIKVYVDVASNLFPELVKKKNFDIKLINMFLYVEDKVYNCYEDHIDVAKFSKSFYEGMTLGKEVHTSLVNPNDYLKYFKDDIEKGNQIICVTMAKGISGTYQSACLARNIINEEQGKEMVYVLDSATAGFGEGIQAIYAQELVKQGKEFKEICQELEIFKWKVRSEFFVDNVRYLAKTGRVKSIVARIANVLRIKPMLYGSYESQIEMTSKVAGRNLAIRKLAKQCIEHIDRNKEQVVYISHCDCYQDALTLKSYLVKEDINNVEIYHYDIITGSHIGPKSLAIFYVGTDRVVKDKEKKA